MRKMASWALLKACNGPNKGLVVTPLAIVSSCASHDDGPCPFYRFASVETCLPCNAHISAAT